LQVLRARAADAGTVATGRTNMIASAVAGSRSSERRDIRASRVIIALVARPRAAPRGASYARWL
jgi:hypothetical protein